MININRKKKEGSENLKNKPWERREEEEEEEKRRENKGKGKRLGGNKFKGKI